MGVLVKDLSAVMRTFMGSFYGIQVNNEKCLLDSWKGGFVVILRLYSGFLYFLLSDCQYHVYHTRY